MQAPATAGNHPTARAWGIIVAVILALLLTSISILILLGTIRDEGGGLILIAIFFGVPLLLIACGIWVYLMVKRAADLRLALTMWLPVLASMSILPIAFTIDSVGQEAFNSAHPDVAEIHVNLTGRDMVPDPDTGGYRSMSAQEPDNFQQVKRQPALNNRADKMTAYNGALLAPGFNSVRVAYDDAPRGKETVVPVKVMPSPAAWTPALAKLGTGDASQLMHYYYHYPARIEVATVIDWRNVRTDMPVVDVYVHNLGALPLVRLELNGQTLRLPGNESIKPLAKDDCHFFPSTALDLPAAPLKLRWQTAQTNPAWQAASVKVPAFRQAEPAKGSITSNSLHLFIGPDGSLAAQRAQLLDTGLSKEGIRVTEVAPAFASAPLCGTAPDHYVDGLERVPN